MTRRIRENMEELKESISIQEKHINDLKLQEQSGIIRQRDKFGNFYHKDDLYKVIPAYEQDLRMMKYKLLCAMEDIVSFCIGKDLDEIRKNIDEYYPMIKEEAEKIKSKLSDKNVI